MRALLRDVGHVDHGVIEPMAIEHLAARAPHEGRWRLRRQLLAGLPHRIFPRDPVLCITPSLKIGLGSFRQKHLPRGLEIGAGLLEGRGGVALMFARMRSGIEAAMPFPWIFVMRVAAARDLTDEGATTDPFRRFDASSRFDRPVGWARRPLGSPN